MAVTEQEFIAGLHPQSPRHFAWQSSAPVSQTLQSSYISHIIAVGRGQLKCDGTRAETRFRLSAKWTSPFKWAGASVQSTIGSRGVRISGSNAGCTMFQGSVKGTGYPLYSPVSPSLPLPCATVGHHISTGVYISRRILAPPPLWLQKYNDPRAHNFAHSPHLLH